MDLLEQPRGGTPVLNVMTICDQRHANISKQTMLLADVDIARPQQHELDHMNGKCFSLRNE